MALTSIEDPIEKYNREYADYLVQYYEVYLPELQAYNSAKSARRRLMGGVALAALVSVLALAKHKDTGQDTSPISPDDKSRIEAEARLAYRSALTYWEPIYPTLDAPELWTASAVECGGHVQRIDIAAYCSSTNAIYIDPSDINGLSIDGTHVNEVALVEVAIDHEFGHGVQQNTGTPDIASSNTEWVADCYAGAALGKVATTDHEAIVSALGTGTQMTTDAHGTAAQRLLHFNMGRYYGPLGCMDITG